MVSGPAPVADQAGIRQLAAALLVAAEEHDQHAESIRRARLGFSGPAARRMRRRLAGWAADLHEDAEHLRELARTLVHAASDAGERPRPRPIAQGGLTGGTPYLGGGS